MTELVRTNKVTYFRRNFLINVNDRYITHVGEECVLFTELFKDYTNAEQVGDSERIV